MSPVENVAAAMVRRIIPFAAIESAEEGELRLIGRNSLKVKEMDHFPDSMKQRNNLSLRSALTVEPTYPLGYHDWATGVSADADQSTRVCE